MLLVVGDGVEGPRLGSLAADGVEGPVGGGQLGHEAAHVGQRGQVGSILDPILVDVHAHQRLAARRHLRRLVLQSQQPVS